MQDFSENHLRNHRAMCKGPCMTDARLIGTVEACEILEINRSTLTRWVAAGKITPVHKLPGRSGSFLFSRAEIMSVLTRQLARTAS